MKEISQIIRFPKKYGDLFISMENIEAGKLIKSLFHLDENNELKGLTKTYFNLIKVDLENLEKSAINGQKGGRPKNKITEGYGKEKPWVMKKHNHGLGKTITKEKEKEKKKEKEKDNTEEKTKKEIIINNGNIFKLINIKEILKKYEITEKDLEIEIEEFINYRTSLVRKGKTSDLGKQLWQIKETFDPNRRLSTWLSNNKKWNKNNFNININKNSIGILE